MNDSKLDKIETKLDAIVEKISDINVVLGKQHVTLEEHTRRSLANEAAVEVLKGEIKPVVSHVLIMNFLAKAALTVLCSDIAWEVFKRLLK